MEGLKLVLVGLDHGVCRANLDSAGLRVLIHWLLPGTIYLTAHNLPFTAPARFIGLLCPWECHVANHLFVGYRMPEAFRESFQLERY